MVHFLLKKIHALIEESKRSYYQKNYEHLHNVHQQLLLLVDILNEEMKNNENR